jgi:hypothetical protein
MLKEIKKMAIMLVLAFIGWLVVMGFVNKGMNTVVEKQISEIKN